jgi:hypothetical protein
MTHLNNFSNDPQEDWGEPEDETCPDCGSDRSEYSHYNANDGTNWSRCLDCDNIYETF